jgi:hypothetical protein
MYLINTLLVILLLSTLVWIGNNATVWFRSKNYHGYEIYNCPKDISKSLEWFEAKKFCQTVERVDDKFFDVDEDDVKERAKRQADTAKFMSHHFGRKAPSTKPVLPYLVISIPLGQKRNSIHACITAAETPSGVQSI